MSDVLNSTVDFLARLAGSALRWNSSSVLGGSPSHSLPGAFRTGIELSDPMVAQLRGKIDASVFGDWTGVEILQEATDAFRGG